MTNPELLKRWRVSETLLKQARGSLPAPAEEKKEGFDRLDREFVSYIEHNEHELALDMVEEMAELVPTRGGFWKDLIRAAENMELRARVPRLQQGFDAALARMKEPE